jgi:UDP-glucuronate decarboxylase
VSVELNPTLKEDLRYIYDEFTERQTLANSVILISGCSGFLGFELLNFLMTYREDIGIRKVIGLDNFMVGKPTWIEELEKKNKNNLNFLTHDLVKDELETIPGLDKVTHVLHMASIASPPYYRKYPIETVDVNIWGLRKLLDYFKGKTLQRFLFFSSSEVYGDPPEEHIPTQESYFGNVSTMGPRACYDEAKRFGETLCYLYSQVHGMPLTIVRPFNNYGPGMKLNDGRLPPDAARAVIENKDLNIFSDGTPTRSFCYVADAIVGYLKVLQYEKFECFNIGMDQPEISIKEFVEINLIKGREIFQYSGEIQFCTAEDKAFLTNNPQRRCPNIDKARNLLGFKPRIEPLEGVERFFKFLKMENRQS